jgi:hypothetical protein
MESVGLLGRGISATYLHHTTQTQNKLTILVFERAKIFRALERAAILISIPVILLNISPLFLIEYTLHS